MPVEMTMWRARPAGQARRGRVFRAGRLLAAGRHSRLWETGAPGHPTYAVPQSYLIGVVTHIYWPPSRWRILH